MGCRDIPTMLELEQLREQEVRRDERKRVSEERRAESRRRKQTYYRVRDFDGNKVFIGATYGPKGGLYNVCIDCHGQSAKECKHATVLSVKQALKLQQALTQILRPYMP